MNLTPAFIRKVLYLACMVPPLLVIVWLGMPAVRSTKGSGSGPTGYLAQLRDANNLSQAKLGEIDPASETMKLSTLGMRGVAVNLLWNQAHKYKMYKDFDNLSVTVNQIVLLQPHFVSVWEFQAHNLSYNVSVEFDDYRDRYGWVTKGIGFLMSGTEYNRNEPRLHSSCGWFLGQKIGRSDEFRQFRRLFRQDDEFQAEINQYVNVDSAKSRADNYPDNWLVSRLWYLRAEQLVVTRNARVRQGPWLFFSQAPRCLINYAIGLDRDGELPPDEISQQAWKNAEAGWVEYGKRELYSEGTEPVRLGELDELRNEYLVSAIALEGALAGLSDDDVEKLRVAARPRLEGMPDYDRVREELSEAFPKFRDYLTGLREQKLAKLDAKYQDAYNKEVSARTAEQRRLAEDARFLMEPRVEDMLYAASEAERDRAGEFHAEFEAAKRKFDDCDSLDALSKYHYWKIRCQVEATKEARQAKSLLYRARQMAEQARLTEERAPDGTVTPGAKELYEQAWDKWTIVFTRNPEMYDNVEESQMLLNDLMEYDRVLTKLELPPLPHDFSLRKLIENDSGFWQGRPLRPKPEDAPEAGTPETGTPETGTPETGTPETGTPETGTPETGTPETGTPGA